MKIFWSSFRGGGGGGAADGFLQLLGGAAGGGEGGASSTSNIVKILLGLAKSYFNVKSGSSPAIQVSPVLKTVFLKFRNSNKLFTITRAGTRLAQKKTKTTKTTWTGPWPSSGTCSSLGRSRRRSSSREATTASRTTLIQAERRTRAMLRWFCLFSPETGTHVLWNFQLRNWKAPIEAKLYLTRDHCHMRHSQRSTQLSQYAWPHSPGMDWWSPRDREDAEWHLWHPTTMPQKRTTRPQFFPHLPTEQTTAAASTMQGNQ